MSATLFLSGLAFALYIVYGALKYGHRRKDMPTGPKTLPFIGNLHQIPRSYTHMKFNEWARQYGGIFTLKMGNANMAVISDRRLVKALVDKRSNIYSDRPRSYVTHNLITKGHHLLVMFYGDAWRMLRRLVHQHFMESVTDKQHLPIVNAEAVQLVHDFMLYPKDHQLHPKRFSNSIINSIVFGIRTHNNQTSYMKRLYTLMDTWAQLLEVGSTPPVDFFPWMKALPERLWNNYKTRSIATGEMMDTLYEDILTDVEKRRETRNVGSFMDLVLDQQDKLQLSRDKLKFLGGVLMEGGSDTTATLILIILQALCLHPEVQEKAHRQIAAVVGEDRSPQWSDMENLPYINMIVKEGHRWRPILPLGFPHSLTQDDWVDGKFLPRGTVIILNVWGMHMNSQTWDEPEKFNPDRYKDHPKLAPEYAASGDWQKRDHYGFGAGRRICPGINLAERNLLIAISKLIWAFRFEHETGPDGRPVPIDSDPVTGYRTGTLWVPNKYRCKPVLRSETIRETVMREYEQAERKVFSRFDVS